MEDCSTAAQNDSCWQLLLDNDETPKGNGASSTMMFLKGRQYECNLQIYVSGVLLITTADASFQKIEALCSSSGFVPGKVVLHIGFALGADKHVQLGSVKSKTPIWGMPCVEGEDVCFEVGQCARDEADTLRLISLHRGYLGRDCFPALLKISVTETKTNAVLMNIAGRGKQL